MNHRRPGPRLNSRPTSPNTRVPYSEMLSGGSPKDGIPAIDDPNSLPFKEADTWLEPVEPVLALQAGDEARAYPLQILIWHEIVNDLVGVRRSR